MGLPQIPGDLPAEEIRKMVGIAPTMLEIGAHEGQHTGQFLEAMPDICLTCFECDPRPIVRFEAKFGNDPRVALWKKAVAHFSTVNLPWNSSAGETGDRDDWDLSGSINTPTGHHAYSPEITFGKGTVASIRLDEWLSHCKDIGRIDFIWADVQGAQVKLISGGLETLWITRFLYIECHETPLYEGEPTQDGLVTLLGLLGLRPLAVYDLNNILFEHEPQPRPSYV